MFTQAQINWAKSHDWFKELRYSRGFYTIVTGDKYTTCVFTDYQKLREWAGY